jgi:phosphoribosyl-ATP pyrophosphohydrolase/phosphoribosyl-AMP cyclohydrolase/histidinol dehydrogenase
MPTQFSQPPFVALVEQAAQTDLAAIARAAPLLVRLSDLAALSLPPQAEHWVLVDAQHSHADALAALDAGASHLVTADHALAQTVDPDRVILHIPSGVPIPSADVAAYYGAALLETSAVQDATSTLRTVRDKLWGQQGSKSSSKPIFTLPPQEATPAELLKIVDDLRSVASSPCLPTSKISTGAAPDNGVSLASLFVSALRTDRADGLFTTVVSSSSPSVPLGLVYSSKESLAHSLATGQATYYSRSRGGLWRKGETSGATQQVVRLRIDCDGDAVEFVVQQKQGTSFCHTEKAISCFGPPGGLSKLEQTLIERRENAPAGSYTKRLFDDPQMLAAKIREEADEVCRAETKEEVAAEVADLIYFALVRIYVPSRLPGAHMYGRHRRDA